MIYKFPDNFFSGACLKGCVNNFLSKKNKLFQFSLVIYIHLQFPVKKFVSKLITTYKPMCDID